MKKKKNKSPFSIKYLMIPRYPCQEAIASPVCMDMALGIKGLDYPNEAHMVAKLHHLTTISYP